MIDSHSHTSYSKHATGSVDELVRASIEAGVSILTITDHAPFPVDTDNRLLEGELDRYFADIKQARMTYDGEITILQGLEFDYMPDTENFTRDLLAGYPLDFAIGSVHYVQMTGEPMVKVWELPRLAADAFLDRYFANLEGLVACGLFDAVGHADILLRGLPEDVFLRRVEPFMSLLARSDMAFELNASGLRKSSLSPLTGQEVQGLWSYPSQCLMRQLIAHNVPFTIGSDAHTPEDAGAGVAELLRKLRPLGLGCISYYQGRRRMDVDIDTLLPEGLSTSPEQGAAQS